ncbi:cell division control protein-like protein, partial [Lineolata rhizophorae]
LDALLHRGPPNGDVTAGLSQLRYRVVFSGGVPSSPEGLSELRIYVWLVLLGASPVSTDRYLDLVHQGASPAHDKIRDDTFRTLATDPLFRRRVTENSLTRVLNAAAWRLLDAHEARVNGWLSPPTMSLAGSPQHTTMTTTTTTTPAAAASTQSSVGYVQGMNVLAAPFLYAARSEAQAFVAFERLITSECPGYVRGSMDGVHRGLALVDASLGVVDARLHAHLMERGLKAELYAFASVLTLCACTPPLPEVLRLWDFLFAYGAHLNILCIVAQLVLIRDQLMASSSPYQILRSFPPLQANNIVAVAVSFADKIPAHLYRQIVLHAK